MVALVWGVALGVAGDWRVEGENLRVKRKTLTKRISDTKYEVLQRSGCLLWDRKPHAVKGCLLKKFPGDVEFSLRLGL